MSTFTVISGVTRSLAKLLEDSSQHGVGVECLKSPAESIPSTAPLIHIYLLRIQQNPFLANRGPIRVGRDRFKAPPVGVNLHYLITPYGNDEIEIQITLGEIIQLLNENPIVPPEFYDPALTGVVEELRIVPHDLPLQELMDLWRAFQDRSYRLSLAYEVSVALIDSEVESGFKPVRERIVDVRTLR